MKRTKNAVFAAFNAAIVSEFAAAGIRPARPLSWHEATPEFEIQTRAGLYTFHHGMNVDPDDKRPLNFCEVMGRFHDPAKASAFVDCNPYSGKWNHNAPLYIPTVEQAREHASAIITRILSV